MKDAHIERAQAVLKDLAKLAERGRLEILLGTCARWQEQGEDGAERFAVFRFLPGANDQKRFTTWSIDLQRASVQDALPSSELPILGSCIVDGPSAAGH